MVIGEMNDRLWHPWLRIHRLIRAIIETGANRAARAVYERWGFAPVELTLAAPLDALVERLAAAPKGPTFGSIHVQTDDRGLVERAVHKALPRFGRSAGTTVSPPSNGWVAVHDELGDRDPTVLHRLAKELSYVIGGVVLAIGVEERFDAGDCQAAVAGAAAEELRHARDALVLGHTLKKGGIDEKLQAAVLRGKHRDSVGLR